MKSNFDIKALPANIAGFFKNLSERGYLAFWLSALFVISALLWSLTLNVRMSIEIAGANKILEERGEGLRLKKHISYLFLNGRAREAGDWFTVENGNLALIFTVPFDGVFCPFLAAFNKSAKIDKIYPLGGGAERNYTEGEGGVFELWGGRIERAAAIMQKEIRTR